MVAIADLHTFDVITLRASHGVDILLTASRVASDLVGLRPEQLLRRVDGPRSAWQGVGSRGASVLSGVLFRPAHHAVDVLLRRKPL